MLTAEQLRRIAGPVCPEANAVACAPALHTTLILADALTVTRAAALLAQVVWETGYLRLFIEAEETAKAYEGRRDLGNVQPGDGVRYRGRGMIHLTGRDNYARYGDELGLDLVGNPDRAAELDVAAQVTAAYWRQHRLNELADARDFREVTRAINGAATDGPPSYHERRERIYRSALEVLGLMAAVA